MDTQTAILKQVAAQEALVAVARERLLVEKQIAASVAQLCLLMASVVEAVPRAAKTNPPLSEKPLNEPPSVPLDSPPSVSLAQSSPPPRSDRSKRQARPQPVEKSRPQPILASVVAQVGAKVAVPKAVAEPSGPKGPFKNSPRITSSVRKSS